MAGRAAAAATVVNFMLACRCLVVVKIVAREGDEEVRQGSAVVFKYDFPARIPIHRPTRIPCVCFLVVSTVAAAFLDNLALIRVGLVNNNRRLKIYQGPFGGTEDRANNTQ